MLVSDHFAVRYFAPLRRVRSTLPPAEYDGGATSFKWCEALFSGGFNFHFEAPEELRRAKSRSRAQRESRMTSSTSWSAILLNSRLILLFGVRGVLRSSRKCQKSLTAWPRNVMGQLSFEQVFEHISEIWGNVFLSISWGSLCLSFSLGGARNCWVQIRFVIFKMPFLGQFYDFFQNVQKCSGSLPGGARHQNKRKKWCRMVFFINFLVLYFRLKNLLFVFWIIF